MKIFPLFISPFLLFHEQMLAPMQTAARHIWPLRKYHFRTCSSSLKPDITHINGKIVSYLYTGVPHSAFMLASPRCKSVF